MLRFTSASLLTSIICSAALLAACDTREDGTPIGQLTVSPPGPFATSGPRGGPFSPDRHTLRVSAEGGLARWEAESSEPWLDVVPATGASDPSRPTSLSLAIAQSAYQLEAGRYEAQVVITNLEDSGNRVTVSVSLDVGVATTLMTLTPTVGLSARGETGGPFSPSQLVYTLEAMDGNLSWESETAAQWITVVPSSGVVQSGQRIGVNVNINAEADALEEGVHDAVVVFRNLSNPADATISRMVRLTIDAPIAMTVGPPEGFNSSGDEGGPFAPVAKNYRLRAQGADIEYEVSDNLEWLDVNPSSGTIPRDGSVVVVARINAAANTLARGNFQGAITFTNLTNGAGSTTRPVVLTVALPPADFTLTTPAADAEGVALRPSFEWEDSLGATTYRLEIASDESFADVVYTVQDLPESQFTIDQDLTGGESYYWRVVAVNAIGETTATNAPLRFTTGEPPPPFLLTAPAAAATNVALTPTFTWTASGAVDRYRLVVATDQALSSPVAEVTDLTGTTHTLGTPLSGATTYYWSVEAENVAGRTTATNAPLSFTTGAGPGPFTLTQPADQALDVNPSPTFSWTAATGALRYRLEVASDASFGSVIATANDVLQTSTTLASPLPAGALVYWRVYAINGIGETLATNAPYRFTTAGQGPGPFTLTAPGNGENSPALPLSLSWADASQETAYVVQIATEAGFTNVVHTSGNLAADVTSYAVPTGILVPGTTYHWRVTASNPGGSTVATNAPFSFVVNDFVARYPFTAAVQEAYAAARIGGGAVLSGHFAGQGRDAWLFGVNAAGGYLFQLSLGGALDDVVTGITGTADGGALISGYSTSAGSGGDEAWLFRTDGSGAVQLQRVYGQTGTDRFYAARATGDGGFVSAGYTTSAGAGGEDAWVVKLDAAGAPTWSFAYGGAAADRAHDVRSTGDGGYVVAGQTSSFGGALDAWVLKLAANGQVSWEHRYGGPEDDGARLVRQTSDDGYAVAGFTRSFGAGANGELWVFKLDASGELLWQQRFGGTTNAAVATALAPTSDDGLLVTVTDTGSTVLKLSSTGAVVWQRRLGTAESPKGVFEAAGRVWLSAEESGPPSQPKLWNLRPDGTPFGVVSTLGPVNTTTTAVPTNATQTSFTPVAADTSFVPATTAQAVSRILP